MDHWTDRLSDYLDDADDLAPAERRELEAHLKDCADCRSTLEELRAVVSRAQSLSPRGPDEDLWPDIAARIESRTRRYSFSMPQLVAAGIALMAMSGGAVWIAQRQTPAPVETRVDRAALATTTPVNLADAPYDQAVADLERALMAGRSKLDPATIKVLEDNLAAIDQAIDQSQHALAADPANTYLYNHLADARKRKLALLRRARAIADLEG